MDRIVVLGSSNTDLVLRVPRLPKAGETVLGGEFAVTAGGKGANQAVAAAKAGGHVTFLGSVGDDDFGKARLRDLASGGVDVSHVQVARGQESGVAVILVDNQGHNLIGVAPGANSALAPRAIDSLSDDLFHPRCTFIAQLETPPATVLCALERARRRGMRTILNPAPMDPRVACQEWLTKVDALVVNEHELRELLGEPIAIEDSESAKASLARLHDLGARTIVVTLGARGYLISQKHRIERHPAFDVEAVDTVAAGDTFVGALAARWTSGSSLRASARWAAAAAALCVTRKGAVAAIPTKDEVEAFLKRSG